MSDSDSKATGSIGWCDLTIGDAERVKDFYREVVGWTATEVDMGGYSDYCMNEPGTGKGIAGVCHAQGVNAGLPAQWLIYIMVEDLEKSVARALEMEGAVVAGPNVAGGHGRYCVIKDPAGAVFALFEPSRGEGV